MSTENGLQVYFVDASLPGYQGLMSSLGEGSRVFVIESTSDAFAQMDAALASLTDPVAGLHVYSHGREGALFLGGQWIDEKSLTNGKANTLASIGNYMTEDGDILLYGCYTGAGVVGESFMAQLARLTRADVAASNNLTGLGGDWVLENKTGSIEAPVVKPEYNGALNPGDTSWGNIIGSTDTTPGTIYTGWVSNDRFFSYTDGDVLNGEAGNDAYFINGKPTDRVDSTQINETGGANGGIDTVFSSVAYFDLGAKGAADPDSQVEYIVLKQQAGMEVQSAKGNNYNQTITGNALDNNLTGGGGNNYLDGGAGNDYLDGGNGKLVGVIDGDGGLIPGGDYNTGNRNTLVGGAGDDNYIIRNERDTIIENANAGIDNVYSFVDYTLGANVENLTLLDGDASGTQASRGIGNALNNVITGNAYDSNTLDGGAGNDTLIGKHDDLMVGGDGNDLLVLRDFDGGVGTGTFVDGGKGTDTLRIDDDMLAGRTDILNVGAFGKDTLDIFNGDGSGSNTLHAQGIEALVYGGGDDDITLALPTPATGVAASIDAGAGYDKLNFDLSAFTVTVPATSVQGIEMAIAATGVASVTKMNTLTTNISASNFEHFVGTDRNDKFTATTYTFWDGEYAFEGGDGNDTIALGAVNYAYYNDFNYDVVVDGGDGADSISITSIQGLSGVSIAGGDGNDTISIGAVTGDSIAAGSGGDNAEVVIDAGDGDNRITVGAVNGAGVTIDAGIGADNIYLTGAVNNSANVEITTDAGNDLVSVSGAISNGASVSINASSGADSIYFTQAISNGADVEIDGGGDNDLVSVTSAINNASLLIYANAGNDTISLTGIISNGASVTINGSSGTDDNRISLSGALSPGANVTIDGGVGNDTINVSGAISGTGLLGTSVNIDGGDGDNIISVTGGIGDFTEVNIGGGAADDKFYLGNVAGASTTVNITGDGGNDSLYFMGGAVDVSIGTDGNATVNKMNNVTLTSGNVTADSIGYYHGTSVGDIFDASTSDLTGLVIAGGLGVDTIKAGTAGNNISLNGGIDQVTLGAGADVLTMTTLTGSGGMVTDFDTGADKIDDSALVGWARTMSAVTVGGLASTKVDWKSGSSVVTTTLINVTDTVNINFAYGSRDVAAGVAWHATTPTELAMQHVINGLGRNSITGGNMADLITVNMGNSAPAVNTPYSTSISGGLGNDTINVVAITGSTVVANRTNIVIDGGADNDRITMGAVSLMRDNRLASGGDTLKDNISISGGLNADYVSITSIAGDKANEVTVYGDSVGNALQGGNDTIIVGAITGNNKDSNNWGGAHVHIDAGAGTDSVSVASISAGALTISGGLGDDTISLGAVSMQGTGTYLTVKATLEGGAGDDVISVGAISGVNTTVAINGDAGEDNISTGSISGNASVSINGGADADIIRIANTTLASTVSLRVDGGDTSADSLYFGAVAGAIALNLTLGSNVTLNAINAYGTSLGDTINATGLVFGADTVGFYTGAGKDVITFGNIAASTKLVVDGGNGDDSISIGNIVAGTTVSLNGGDGVDTLNFGGTSAVGLALNVAGVASGVSVGDVANSNVTVSGFEYYRGGDGNDSLDASAYKTAPMTLEGGAGNDTLAIYNGRLIGGAGDDLLIVKNVTSGISVAGGAGYDTLQLNNSEDMRATLNAANFGSASTAGNIFTSLGYGSGTTVMAAASVSATGIAAVQFGHGADIINVTGVGAYSVDGGLGADVINVASVSATTTNYNAYIDGNLGNDTITLGNFTMGGSVALVSQVYVTGGAGSDTINAGTIQFSRTGITSLLGPHTHVDIYGGTGDDGINITSIAGYGDVVIHGDDYGASTGKDTITVGTIAGSTTVMGAVTYSTNVRIYGGAGNDNISVDAITGGTVHIEGGAGDDKFYLGNVSGTSTTVNIYGGDSNGGAGSDSLYFTGGAVNVAITGNNATVSSMNAVALGSRVKATDVESYHGTSVGDTFTVTTGLGKSLAVDGGAGNDTITFGAVAPATDASINVNVLGGDGADNITFGAITAADSTTVNVNVLGGVGNDIITVGTISQTGTGEANVTLTGGTGTDLYVLKADGMGATIAGETGDGNDTVKVWGLADTLGSNLAALQKWSVDDELLVFKRDVSGNVLMSFDGGVSTTNILTFTNVQGTDNLGFYNATGNATENRLFGGDVNLTALYTAMTAGGVDAGDWYTATFTTGDVYGVSGVTKVTSP